MAALPIRVGIIGAGGNTKLQHIPKLQALPGVLIKVVSNRSAESSAAVAQQFGIPKSTPNWRSVVEDPELDAIVIGTWPNMHRTLVCAALQAGKHVLCEARMAMNYAEAKEMLREAQRRPSLVSQIVPSPYTLAYDDTIRHIVASGQLGRLTYVTVRSQAGWADEWGAPLTFRNDKERSGDNILSMGILYEALARWVGHATSVMAMGQTVVKMRTDPGSGELRAADVPDHVDILASMACGAQAHLVFSAVSGGRSPGMEFWLHGTEGTLHLDVSGQALMLTPRGGQAAAVPLRNPGGWRVEEEFVGAIRGEEPVRLTDFVAGTRYMEFTSAVAESMRTGRAVGLGGD